MDEDTLMKVFARNPDLLAAVGSAIAGAVGYAAHRIHKMLNPKQEDEQRFPLYDEIHGITYTRTEEYCWERNRHAQGIEEEPEEERHHPLPIPEDPFPRMSLRDAVKNRCPATVEAVVMSYHDEGIGYSGFVVEGGYAAPFRAPDEYEKRLSLQLLLEDSRKTQNPLKIKACVDKRGVLVWND